MAIGQELGFGSVEYDDFVYCGKRVRMKSDGSVVINMTAYHENLRPMEISLRKTPEAELTNQIIKIGNFQPFWALYNGLSPK